MRLRALSVKDETQTRSGRETCRCNLDLAALAKPHEFRKHAIAHALQRRAWLDAQAAHVSFASGPHRRRHFGRQLDVVASKGLTGKGARQHGDSGSFFHRLSQIHGLKNQFGTCASIGAAQQNHGGLRHCDSGPLDKIHRVAALSAVPPAVFAARVRGCADAGRAVSCTG